MPAEPTDRQAEIVATEEGVLKWACTGIEGQLNFEDIVCAVPNPERRPGCRVLFLDKNGGTGEDSSIRLATINIPSIPVALTSFLAEIPIHLRCGEPVQVVISTRSGTGTARAVFQDLLRPFLRNLSVDYRVYETQSAQSILELSQSLFLSRASTGVPQTIILLSGDGGLIDILDVFSKSKDAIRAAPTLALIPCGTGNAMASSMGLRSGPASGLAPLLRGQPIPLPTFTVKLSPGSQMVTDEGKGRVSIEPGAESDTATHHTMYGAVVASWGLHAALVADSDTTDYRRFGSERFKMAAKELLYPSDGSESHRFRGQITMTTTASDDDADLDLRSETVAENEHMYVLATLVPRLEKDFLISPDSVPLSGKIRFLRFGPQSPEEAMRLMTLAYQGGQHVREESVTYREVESLRIDFQEELERWRRVCIDGKIVVVEKGGWIVLSKEPRQLLCVLQSGP
ncbi:hypothetical protein N7532_001258 [Penicillium argentinense]|uniref:DAGKc domain-containing protein n=1 Tax=Penicillium argentinense TaxID=1131581 RepID=A0A9W9G293_9EURO|nr:uncharacterized protein N7532_001258 [Penicillium argentinense]KAJ5110723.1 hypothetical protein N7532_001258 [Penicillium argentinense]